MSNFFSNKAFKLDIFSGIFLYAVIYIHNLPPVQKITCFDCEQPSGFPFISYQPGNAVTMGYHSLFWQIANISVAILFIFAVGLTFSFIWSKTLKK